MTPLRLTLCGALLAALTGCPGSGAKKMEEKQKALDERKAAEAAKLKEKEAAAAPKKDTFKLDAPWEDASYVELRPDGPCPPNFWALFPKGDVPGADKAEKKANEAKRADLAKALLASTYFVKLRAPDNVKLLPYDAPKGWFPLEVVGTIDCTDSIGRVALAWTPAKAGDPGNSAAKQDADVTQNIWTAEALKFTVPQKGMADAKDFEKAHKFDLSARLFFKLGKTEINKKMKKMPKVDMKAAGEKIDMGGGMEDWGAGRMVHAEGLGVRVATDREKTSLAEKKP